MSEDSKDLLRTMLESLVDKPEEIEINTNIDEMGVLLTVKLGQGDAGAVIGRQGKTIQAIRTIMSAVGLRSRQRLSVKLDVPDAPKRTGEEIKESLEDLKL